MSFSHGRDAKIAFSGSNLTSYLNEVTTTTEVDTGDTTTFGNDARSYVVGLRDGSISMSGIFDGETDAVDDVMYATLGTEDGGQFMVMPVGDAVGNRAWFGVADTTSYEVQSPISDVVSVTADVNADGGVYSGVYLRAAGTGAAFETIAGGATDDGASVDNTASTSDGARAQLHVMNNDLDGALDVKVQHSPDDTTWADLATFTQVAAATDTAEQVESTGTVDQYVRSVVDATAATTGSAEVAVALKRN